MCESAYRLYMIYLPAIHTVLNFSKACDFKKSVNSIKGPDELQMNSFILMSEWCNKELQFPAGLFLSHSTLINISQPARMVCYLNLMNFCTEWNASNWRSVIKQNRREYKSPENTKEGTNTGKEKSQSQYSLYMAGLGCTRKSQKCESICGRRW